MTIPPDQPDPAPPVPDSSRVAHPGSAHLDTVRERITAIDQAATQYLRAQRPANTTRSYAGDWRVWCQYCARVGVSSRDVSPGLVVGFALWLEQGDADMDRGPAAPATIRRRVYGAVAALREQGTPVPEGATAQANEAVKAYERRLAQAGERRGRGSAPAVGVRQLREMCAALPDTLAGTRDRAILLLGFALAARRAELAQLFVDDLTGDPHGLLVHIRSSKTGERTVAVPYGQRAATCPVRAWHTWQASAGLTGGRALRSLDRHGRLGESLTAHGIGRVISTAGEQAGLLNRVTAHSLRAGLATEARRAGHDTLSIARQGGWADDSAVLFGYMHTVDRWHDNPLTDLGL